MTVLRPIESKPYPIEKFRNCLVNLLENKLISKETFDHLYKVIEVSLRLETEIIVKSLKKQKYDVKEISVRKLHEYGVDIYHTTSHNCFVSIIAVFLFFYNKKDEVIDEKELENLILAALFHDNVDQSSTIEENATWSNNFISEVLLESGYSKTSTINFMNDISDLLGATNYGDKANSFFVSFEHDNNYTHARWHKMSEVESIIVMSDWLAQSFFSSQRRRNLMIMCLFDYWEKVGGKSNHYQYPYKSSVFVGACRCLIQLPDEVWGFDYFNDMIINDLWNFQVYKPRVPKIFESLDEIEKLGAKKAVNKVIDKLN